MNLIDNPITGAQKNGTINMREPTTIAGDNIDTMLAGIFDHSGLGPYVFRFVPLNRSIYVVAYDAAGAHLTSPANTPFAMALDPIRRCVQIATPFFATEIMNLYQFRLLGNDRAHALLVGDREELDPAVIFSIAPTATEDDLINLTLELRSATGRNWTIS